MIKTFSLFTFFFFYFHEFCFNFFFCSLIFPFFFFFFFFLAGLSWRTMPFLLFNMQLFFSSYKFYLFTCIHKVHLDFIFLYKSLSYLFFFWKWFYWIICLNISFCILFCLGISFVLISFKVWVCLFFVFFFRIYNFVLFFFSS